MGENGSLMAISHVHPPSGTTRVSPGAALAKVEETGAKLVDFKFIDLPGLWQHFSIPASELTEELFAEGIGFDGSSIRGFQKIHESDMLLIPDPDTALVDPGCKIPTLSIICDVAQPGGLDP